MKYISSWKGSLPYCSYACSIQWENERCLPQLVIDPPLSYSKRIFLILFFQFHQYISENGNIFVLNVGFPSASAIVNSNSAEISAGNCVYLRTQIFEDTSDDN